MAEPVLCLLAYCRMPGRHGEDCPGDDCRGCQRARAADGLRLCSLHTDRLGQDVLTAAQLYDELALRLQAGTGSGEPVSGTSDTTRLPNPAAVEMRTEIRHVLAGWTRLIAEERGFHLPADEVAAMARYIKRSVAWLAAGEYADEAAGELHDLRGRAWGIAYPSGTRRVAIAPCPLCAGTVHALLRATDSTLPSVLACDADGEHQWAAPEWRAFARAVKARAA